MKKLLFCLVLMITVFSSFAITKEQSESLLKLAQDNSGFFETDFSGNYTVVQEKPGEGKSVTEAVLYRRDKNAKWTILITGPAKEKGSIEYFCAKKQMDIEGLGPQTVDYLYDKGYIHTIADLYRFDFTSLADVERGFGLKKTQAITQALQESRKRPFRRVLAGLGMNEFSHNVIQILQKSGYKSKNSLYDLVSDPQKAREILTTINGIGPLTGEEVIKGLTDPENRKLLDELESFGLCMDDGLQMEEDSGLEQIFSGQSWCVTGTFENFQPREKAMEEIKKRGGTEVSSVSRKTSCLLAGKNAGSKLEKAREYGVKIVDEQEFLKMIGGSNHGHEPEDQDLFGGWER